MPFVSDIAGPQQAVRAWPPLTPGTLRRTSTIDTHPAGPNASDVDLRGRDAMAGETGAVTPIGEVHLRAHLTDRVVDEIADVAAPIPDARLSRLLGSRVGPGFRATVASVLPDDATRSTLLHLLLDDWAGAALVSGYALQHIAITSGVEEKLPPGVADKLAGICAGFAEDASLVGYAQRNGVIPSVRGPAAPAFAAGEQMHAVAPLRPHGMRRFRRMDVAPADAETVAFDAHFRDSHVDQDGAETIVHEYTVVGAVELSTRTITDVTASVRVLPWQECPGAIGSAARVRGMALSDLRSRIRGEFVGTSTCTHLNDTLRALGDLDALLDLSP